MTSCMGRTTWEEVAQFKENFILGDNIRGAFRAQSNIHAGAFLLKQLTAFSYSLREKCPNTEFFMVRILLY